MSKLYKAKTEEWLLVDGNMGKVGLTEYAAKELGDLVFIELPSVGTNVTCGIPFCTVESVKAVSETYSPCCGVITAVNDELDANPGKINEDPLGTWIVEIEVEKISDELELVKG